ncbi:DUF637 domain-containing protein [Aeromonas sanarellii]|uniref:DUF637 domain-containing protein n=1 Tax=Aeromonas sanarellii TaxID=633415 RepID=UPI0038D24A75
MTATDEHFYRKDEKKSGVMVKMSGNGTNSTTERQNQLDGAEINITAGQGVLLQVGQREGESLQARLDTLATQPGMAWVEQVRTMPGVQMEAVQEAYEQWSYSQQSLSPVASAIIAIALAVATGGAGALAMGAAEGTVSAAMANAAFSTLVSQATVSTINNGGNLGAVLKEMGSSANIKQLATSVASAGALQGLDNAMGWANTVPAASDAASQPAASNLFSWDTFGRVTSHSAVTAGINTTINGSHFADAFKASLLSNIQGEVGKSTANWIGDQGIKFDAANSPLAEAGKIAAHGITSGAIAEITGGKFAAGAAGGAMSELASNWSLSAFGGNEEYQVALNKVLGGLAAVAVTGDENDFDTGADRAETVHRYNYLSHQQKAQRDKELSNCTTPQACLQTRVKWAAIDLGQDGSFAAGMAAGVPASLYETAEGIVKAASSPIETLDALKALFNSGDALGKVSDVMKQSYIARIEKLKAEYQKAGASGSFNVGVESGKLVTDIASLVAGGAGLAKGGALVVTKVTGKATSVALDALGGGLTSYELLVKNGGTFASNGRPLMDFRTLTNAQKGVIGDLLGSQKIQQAIPGAQEIGRVPGVGQTGIDGLYIIDKPGVDYLVVEYKFGSSKQGMTKDGLQGSDGWLLGSKTHYNRILESAGKNERLADNIIKSMDAGRIEMWCIRILAVG